MSWTAQDASQPKARLTVAAETGEVALSIDDAGRLRNPKMRRWGNPGGGEFWYEDFGGVAGGEATFGGHHSNQTAHRLVFRDQPV